MSRASALDGTNTNTPGSLKRIHFVGIAGAGLAPLAICASTMVPTRFKAISGSDASESPKLRRLTEKHGILTYAGSNAAHIQNNVDVVVRSTAVPDDDVELATARKYGIPILSRSHFVPDLLEQSRIVAIAGTHGKTTTTGMAAVAAVCAQPSTTTVRAIVGGDVADFGSDTDGFFSNQDGDVNDGAAKPVAIVEADEYGGMFDLMSPHVAVITSVEWEHVDYYRTPESYHAAFDGFASRSRVLLACADDEGALAIARKHPNALLYGTSRDCVVGNGGGFHVDEEDRTLTFYSSSSSADDGILVANLDVPLPGRYNLLNGAAAVAANALLEMADEETTCTPSRSALAAADAACRRIATFRGVARRFELLTPSPLVLDDGATFEFVDDYAHHPTEIASALSAMREKFDETAYGTWVVVQAHTQTRLAAMHESFADALASGVPRGCWICVVETFRARDEGRLSHADGSTLDGSSQLDARALVGRLQVLGCSSVTYASSVDDAITKVLDRVGTGGAAASTSTPRTAVLTLGAGDVTRVGRACVKRLQT